jgi:transposase-like protein
MSVDPKEVADKLMERAQIHFCRYNATIMFVADCPFCNYTDYRLTIAERDYLKFVCPQCHREISLIKCTKISGKNVFGRCRD